jgi:pimeloyl-ACP methyl ester carboxylesterase
MGGGAKPVTDPTPTRVSWHLAATAADLPPAVARALANPADGVAGSVDAGGIHWGTLSWGRPADPPLLLVHGVTSNAAIWWRVAPALAATDRHVIAVDMPGHGAATAWLGRYRFTDTATELAGFIRTAGLDRPDLAVVGHSWGAMVSAHLPIAGIRPSTIVLIDPPHLSSPSSRPSPATRPRRPYSSLDEARAVIRAENPGWSVRDVEAKALALTEFDAESVLAVLLQNGPWDAGLAGLREPAASGIPAWVIRGEWVSGGFIPETEVPAIEAQIGAGHVITIAGGPHSPQRTHPEATVLAILRALGGEAIAAEGRTSRSPKGV